MSIYFDFAVGPKGRMFRRAVESDKYDIELIWNREQTEQLFYDVDIGMLIELSALAICMINENKEVIGFMALNDYPNVRGLDPADWENWIRNLYQRFYLSRNTLFVHFMCSMESISDLFIEEAFISVFLNDCYLQFIVLTVPMDCPEDLITKYFTFKKRNLLKYTPKVKDGEGNYLLTALRSDFCPKLKMRRAVEEDNDDIVAILDKKCPRLKEMYGEFYISEIIGRHPESHRQILVADIQGRAVAVMCINTDINYKQLQSMYELKPFHGLRTATALEKEQKKRSNALLTNFGQPIMRGQWSPFDRPSVSKLQQEDQVLHKSHRNPLKKASRVNFHSESIQRILVHNDSDEFSEQLYMPMGSMTTSITSVMDLLDEDPFDYDIVNIDATLLNTDCISRDFGAPSLLIKSSFFINPSFITQQPSTMDYAPSSTNIMNTKKPNKKPQPKNVQIMEKDSAIYHGTENAFMIELFAFREEIDERYGYDMLEAAFELTKVYEYCIIRVPSADKSFFLLQHFCFVPMRRNKCCQYSLYVAHRSAVLGKLRVRQAEIIDVPHIAHLMTTLEGKDTISTVETMINKSENQAYVITSGMHIIGLGILDDPEQIDYIRARYNLDSYQIHKYRHTGHGVDAGFAILKCVIMYPAFEAHFRFFARDMMRLSGRNTLLYMTNYRNKWAVHKANSIVASMVPLMPRTVDIDSRAIPELRRLSLMTERITAFSTWFIGRKITTMPKMDVNTRIVIIGASRTALGFLNALLFAQTSTYLTFNNVTLISPNGLPYVRHSKSVAATMFLRNFNSSDKYLKSVPYTYYVNIIQGVMMEIDLQEKFVTLTSGSKYYYDLLFLFFGKQYQHPDHMIQLRDNNYKYTPPPYMRLDVPKFSDTEIQIANDETPENVFIINNIAEANKALNYINELFMYEEDMKVIVYGATIHAYLCINALLESKVPPESIVFVEPFPYENPTKTRVPVFHNANVDQTVINILETMKIKVYRSFYFKSWSVTVDNIITHADFLSHNNYINLPCNALFYYGRVGVNMRAFIAIHKSGLAYDGGIVIDHNCRTLDPYVYAAGPCTRYHKRYYADTRSHKYYDSYEIGEKLGEKIRKQLDPLFVEVKPPFSFKWSIDQHSCSMASRTDKGHLSGSSKRSMYSIDKAGTLHKSDYARPEMALIHLKKPKVMCGVLPGGLKYLEVRSPGLKIPHHYVQSMEYNGFVYETFKNGYFRIHLTKDLIVDGITCLSRGKFPLENFKHIYGRPASELNNMHLRFMANRLDDFFEFFRSPWAFFFYHDMADDLFAMIKQLFPKGQLKGLTLKEALCEVGVTFQINQPTLTTSTKMSIQENFEKSPYIEAATEYLIDWLTRNEVLLPMYWRPGINVVYQHDILNHPMFLKKKKRNISEMLNIS